jgi:threonine synthase
LKDPNITVAYHSGNRELFEEVLAKRNVRRASFANRPVQVTNDLEEIESAIQINS